MAFREDAVQAPQHTEEYLNTTFRCGQNKLHLVRVHRSNWPPKQAHPHSFDVPTIAGRCERCGVNMLVANPPSKDTTVVLYGDASEVAGQVVDEGAVVEESALAPAGVVVDEPAKGRK